MNWNAWQPTYRQILADFGWSEDDDRQAAHMLASHLGKDMWKHVGTELKHRPRVVVVGCAPALEDLRAADLPQGVVVAADGAATRLMELGVVPRVVVTDLDGHPDGLRWAASQGASMVVHAHGDNATRLAMVEELGPLVAGSYQCSPDAALTSLRNIGGFTDGDRAVLLCEHYQVREVVLVAFDTTATPSRYSHHYDPATKARKLAWCDRILDEARRRGVRITVS